MEDNRLLLPETQEEIENSKPIPIFRLIYLNLLLIVTLTIIGAMAGIGYSFYKVKPYYTASCKVLFSTTISSDEGDAESISLARLYLPTVETILKSPLVQNRANEIYEVQYGTKGGVWRGNMSVGYSDKSLIFTMSYTSLSEDNAEKALDSYFKAASEILKSNDPETGVNLFINAAEVGIERTQNEPNMSVRYDRSRYIIVGTAAGLIISIAIVLLKFVLDNKVKDPEELERLTGTSLIAYISNNKE